MTDLKRSIMLFASLIVLSTSASSAAEPNTPKGSTGTYTINSQEFAGFEQCQISDRLAETIKGLMASQKPLQKSDIAWSFAIATELFGLPAKELQVGVCDASGERSCGWGSYLAVVLAKPIGETKKHLHKRFGADLTKEVRDQEFQVTLRPVLAKGKRRNESLLFCDPGNL